MPSDYGIFVKLLGLWTHNFALLQMHNVVYCGGLSSPEFTVFPTALHIKPCTHFTWDNLLQNGSCRVGMLSVPYREHVRVRIALILT